MTDIPQIFGTSVLSITLWKKKFWLYLAMAREARKVITSLLNLNLGLCNDYKPIFLYFFPLVSLFYGFFLPSLLCWDKVVFMLLFLFLRLH